MKIRLGDRVRHRTRPNLGEGEVWELRANGRVSVHWDRDKAKAGHSPHFRQFMPGIDGGMIDVTTHDTGARSENPAKNKRHYAAKNLEVLPKRTGIIFHGSPNEDPKVSKGCLLLLW